MKEVFYMHYEVSNEEKEKIIKSYFSRDDSKKLIQLPTREKKKLVVLDHIQEQFERNRKYSEKEVNEILKKIYDDFVLIRRELVDYGFLDRYDDCSEYWVK